MTLLGVHSKALVLYAASAVSSVGETWQPERRRRTADVPSLP